MRIWRNTHLRFTFIPRVINTGDPSNGDGVEFWSF